MNFIDFLIYERITLSKAAILNEAFSPQYGYINRNIFPLVVSLVGFCNCEFPFIASSTGCLYA